CCDATKVFTAALVIIARGKEANRTRDLGIAGVSRAWIGVGGAAPVTGVIDDDRVLALHALAEAPECGEYPGARSLPSDAQLDRERAASQHCGNSLRVRLDPRQLGCGRCYNQRTALSNRLHALEAPRGNVFRHILQSSPRSQPCPHLRTRTEPLIVYLWRS